MNATSSNPNITITVRARLPGLVARSVTLPATVGGAGVILPATGPVVAPEGPGVIVTVTTDGPIVTVVTGNTAGAVGTTAGAPVGTGASVGTSDGDATGEGVRHGTGVAPGDGVADGTAEGVGDGNTVGVGVDPGGHGEMLIIVGTGRGVVIGPPMACKPAGSSDMLCMVRWLMVAPMSMSYMGMTYTIAPTKHIRAKKFNRALSIGLPRLYGQVPDHLFVYNDNYLYHCKLSRPLMQNHCYVLRK
jgi:hypothetical protein